MFTNRIGSLGIAVISLHLGAKNAFWRETPPHMGGITANPKEASLKVKSVPGVVGGVVSHPTATTEPCMRLSTSHGS
jgi:hypothetical protein